MVIMLYIYRKRYHFLLSMMIIVIVLMVVMNQAPQIALSPGRFNPLPARTERALPEQYRARPACTSMQTDQAQYCWLANLKFST